MSQLYYSFTDTTATVVGCDLDYEGEVVIPETVNEINVTSIETNAFRYCSLITSVTVPDTVTSIGEYAFCECTSLTSINIPTITAIPVGCFKGCKSLKSIDFNNVTTIGNLAFAECSSFNMILPSTITSVGVRAFHHTGISNLSISDNLLSIGDGAFCWCPLESISIGSNNANYIIEDNVLYNADKTELILYPPFKTDTTFTIPETVTRINKYAFEENYYMEKIRINNAMVTLEGLCGLMNIKDFECYNSDRVINQTTNGYRALTNTTSNKVYLFYQNYLCRVPIDETSLDGCPYSFSGCLSGAFSGCSELINIDTNQYYCIGNFKEMLAYKCFYKCNSLVLTDNDTIQIPTTVGIDEYAFAECYNIQALNIDVPPNAMDSIPFNINEYAFYNCNNMVSISISRYTKTFETKSHCFENCTSLRSFNLTNSNIVSEITSEKNAFLNTANTQSTLSCEIFDGKLVGCFGFCVETPMSDNKTLWYIYMLNPNVVSIILGNGMTKLMGYTFSNRPYSLKFTNLQYVKFPSTLTEIGGYAFYNTTLNMNNVDFSDCNITTVEPYAFYGVTNLNINLGNLKYVGQYAFYQTTFSNKINININDDNSLVVFESYAFSESVGLESINVVCSDIYIGASLSDITLGDYQCNFNTIQYYNTSGSLISGSLGGNPTGSTFEGNQNTVVEVNITSNNIYFTGYYLFAKNLNLKTLNIKSENQTYNSCDYFCSECYNLKDVIVSGFISGHAFANCANLKAIKFYKMQSSTSILGYWSFQNCHLINTLDFSESGLTEIDLTGINSYKNSELFCLKNLILPENLITLTLASLGIKGENVNLPQSLKNLTIQNCTSLSEINIPKNVESITFNGSPPYGNSIRKLKVPNGCVVNNGYYTRNSAQIPIKITYY